MGVSLASPQAASAQPSGYGYGIHGRSMPGISRSGGVSMRNMHLDSGESGNGGGSGAFYGGSSTHDRMMSSLDRFSQKLVAKSVAKDHESQERKPVTRVDGSSRRQPASSPQTRKPSGNQPDWSKAKTQAAQERSTARQTKEARKRGVTKTSSPWPAKSKGPHRSVTVSEKRTEHSMRQPKAGKAWWAASAAHSGSKQLRVVQEHRHR